MQMYRVEFRTYVNKTIDQGVVIVCAPDNQTAQQMALAALGLPGSSTRCCVQRVKPSVYEVERRLIPISPKPSLRNHGLRP